MANRWRAALAALLLIAALPVLAGTSCEEREPDAATVARALDLAYRTRVVLDTSGAELALIARAGQDLSRYGLRYSHLGFVWRDHPKGAWRVIHELNTCGTDRSDIFDEGLGNFFLDDLWRMEGVLLVPEEATRQRLVEIFKKQRHLDFHESRYSMVAYPFSTRYQNSNQWALEVLAAAQARDAPVTTRQDAQQWLKFAGYEATELRIDTLTRLGARMSKANIAFDDHPSELRWSDRIRTVTVDSVLAFILRREPKAERLEISLRR